MVKREVTLKNDSGMHARPASKFTKMASTFKSDINVEYKEKSKNLIV